MYMLHIFVYSKKLLFAFHIFPVNIIIKKNYIIAVFNERLIDYYATKNFPYVILDNY